MKNTFWLKVAAYIILANDANINFAVLVEVKCQVLEWLVMTLKFLYRLTKMKIIGKL